jgi:hypothetical protein
MKRGYAKGYVFRGDVELRLPYWYLKKAASSANAVALEVV